jgi:hypothetical protein
MQRESFGFLRVIPIWVALMSGLFSIVREIANLYPPTQTALWNKKIFWACVWVTFVASSLTAWVLKHHELIAEKAKNIEPRLAGRIDCLNVDPTWSIESFEPPSGRSGVNSVFEFHVTIWNESSAATTVSGFELRLVWAGVSYDADKLPVDEFFIDHTFHRSEPFERGYEVKRERLVGFPPDTEITNRNHVGGWLRFLVRESPWETLANATLHKDVTWVLLALDRKGQPHRIYEGGWNLPPCGAIERREITLY